MVFSAFWGLVSVGILLMLWFEQGNSNTHKQKGGFPLCILVVILDHRYELIMLVCGKNRQQRCRLLKKKQKNKNKLWMENLLTVSPRALSHHSFFHGVSFISTSLKYGYNSPDENNNKVERETVKAKQEQKRYYRCCLVYLWWWAREVSWTSLFIWYSLRLNRRNKTANELTFFYPSKCARGLAQEKSLPPHFPWTQTRRITSLFGHDGDLFIEQVSDSYCNVIGGSVSASLCFSNENFTAWVRIPSLSFPCC